jgi:hypothetical protein
MQNMTETQLSETLGGGDSLAKDIGQLVGGTAGWLQANYLTYLILGPGIGGLAAISAGLKDASL